MSSLRALLCMAVLSCFTMTPSESPFNISDDLIEKFPELIWLKELYLGAQIVSEMKQEELDKSIILCDQCENQLSCSNVGGVLISKRDLQNLEALKELIIVGDGTIIAEFMLQLCNTLKIVCHKCQTFSGWHSL
jgi:hypothetical protein